MDEEVAKVVDSCYLCRISKSTTTQATAFGQKEYAQTPRSQWLFDIAPMNPTRSYNYIYIFCDAFTQKTKLVAAKTRNTEEIIDAVKTHIIGSFGLFDYFYSDNEPAIKSQVFTDFLTQLGITPQTNAPHSPFTNGVAEKLVALTKEAIRLFVRSTSSDWVEQLPFINMGLNHRLLSSGHTPDQLMFGSTGAKNDLIKTIKYTETPEEYVKMLTFELNSIHKRRLEIRDRIQKSKNDSANKRRKEKTFHLNQIVVVKNYKIASVSGTALLAKWLGPYQIIELDEKRRLATLEHIHDHSIRRASYSNMEAVKNNEKLTRIDDSNEAIRKLKPYRLRDKNIV